MLDELLLRIAETSFVTTPNRPLWRVAEDAPRLKTGGDFLLLKRPSPGA